MKRSTKLLLMASGLFFLLVMVAVLVGGKTYKMHSANQRFSSPELGNQEKALSIYQDLAIDLPASPYVRHNLGLAYHTAGRWHEALIEYQKGEAELEKGDPRTQEELSLKYHYHLGSTLFYLGENSPPEEAVNCYQQALSHFMEALRADPTDPEAKYNYELTKLRLEETTQPPKEQNQNDREQGDESTPDQPPTDDQSSAEREQANQPAPPEEQKQQPPPEPVEGMSKEEAEALLEMAENGEAYHAPFIISTPTPPGKDW